MMNLTVLICITAFASSSVSNVIKPYPFDVPSLLRITFASRTCPNFSKNMRRSSSVVWKRTIGDEKSVEARESKKSQTHGCWKTSNKNSMWYHFVRTWICSSNRESRRGWIKCRTSWVRHLVRISGGVVSHGCRESWAHHHSKFIKPFWSSVRRSTHCRTHHTITCPG